MLGKEWDKYLRKNLPKPVDEHAEACEWGQGFSAGYGDASTECNLSQLTDDRMMHHTAAYRQGYRDGYYQYEHTIGARKRARQEQLNQMITHKESRKYT